MTCYSGSRVFIPNFFIFNPFSKFQTVNNISAPRNLKLLGRALPTTTTVPRGTYVRGTDAVSSKATETSSSEIATTGTVRPSQSETAFERSFASCCCHCRSLILHKRRISSRVTNSFVPVSYNDEDHQHPFCFLGRYRLSSWLRPRDSSRHGSTCNLTLC